MAKIYCGIKLQAFLELLFRLPKVVISDVKEQMFIVRCHSVFHKLYWVERYVSQEFMMIFY